MTQLYPLGRGRSVDVAIVGAGVVGATLAALLARAGHAVAILERSGAPEPATTSCDPRVLALTHASRNILAHAGVWPAIVRGRHGCFRRMHVWDAAGAGAIAFDAADLGEPTLGYIVESRLVVLALDQAIHALPSIAVYRHVSLRNVLVEEDSVVITLDDGRRLSASVLVGADGADSRVRELSAIGQIQEHYGQSALTTVVRTSLPHEETARQRFLPTGPLAFLPLDDAHLCAVVWSTTPEDAALLLQANASQFDATLAAAFDHRLGAVESVSARSAHPLTRAHAQTYVLPRVALVGDAAHTVHPLAGQGANLGLLDAAALAETVTGARLRGRDIGDLSVLRRYARWRRADNDTVQSAMDAFHWLFGARSAALVAARNFGLGCTDRVLPVKQYLARRAMGLVGDLPALARSASLARLAPTS